MSRALLLVGAYVIGSIPFAYLIVRAAGQGDVRAAGSGNVGATNALRLAGWRWALLVLVLDIGKGVLAVWLMRLATANPAWAAAAGLAAVGGHCFPVWLRFAGGKGVATAAGVFALTAPLALASAAAVWVVVVALSRYVALASLVAAASLPVALHLLGRSSPAAQACAVATALVVMWRHLGNLARLVRGEEPRVGKERRR